MNAQAETSRRRRGANREGGRQTKKSAFRAPQLLVAARSVVAGGQRNGTGAASEVGAAQAANGESALAKALREWSKDDSETAGKVAASSVREVVLATDDTPVLQAAAAEAAGGTTTNLPAVRPLQDDCAADAGRARRPGRCQRL